jgi:hypothetical protein
MYKKVKLRVLGKSEIHEEWQVLGMMPLEKPFSAEQLQIFMEKYTSSKLFRYVKLYQISTEILEWQQEPHQPLQGQQTSE